MLPLSLELDTDALVTNSLGITYFDGLSLNRRFEEDILVMIQAADEYLENNQKPVHFHVKHTTDTTKTSLRCFTFVTCRKKRIFWPLRCF